MFQEHYIFKLSSDKNKIVFRYFDFWKFQDLIKNSELYHSSLGEMTDKHEGTVPERIIKIFYEEALLNHGEDYAKAMMKIWSPSERDKKENFISSWSLHRSESFAMWKIYTKNKDAVAIQSTISNLISAFDFDKEYIEYIGKIKYFDGRKYLHRGNPFDPLLYKWVYYSFEEELRVLIHYGAEKGWEELNNWPKGIKPKVNLDKLIDAIYLAPFAGDKQYEQVKEMLTKRALNKPIYYSGIKDKIY